MVAHGSICLRRLSGSRAGQVRFGRFLASPAVTLERRLAGGAGPTRAAATGRHGLAIQDTREIGFKTTPERRRALGEIGKGTRHGLLRHAMLAQNAENGACLGLVAGQLWTRRGRITTAHRKRPLAEKEAQRWRATAEQAKAVLTTAAMVTPTPARGRAGDPACNVADRESDIDAEWARLPGPNVHLLTRVMQNRCWVDGGMLFTAAERFPPAGTRHLALPASRPKRPLARQAEVSLRLGRVRLKRPRQRLARALPAAGSLTLIEVVETDPPAGVEPVHWRLLTTHEVADAAAAWRVVGWYKARGTIEPLFRILKTQGLRLEDSQLAHAERLLKLTAIATRAAAVTLPLMPARDDSSAAPAELAFSEVELATLDARGPHLEGRPALQTNPHPRRSLAWAAWIMARLGGWTGYPSERPPGPITFKQGLDYFHACVAGWQLRDLCMP